MGGKVHNCICPAQRFRQSCGISNVADDQFEAFSEFPVTGAQIVVDDDFIALALKDVCSMTAYISSSTNYQNGQESSRDSPTIIIEAEKKKPIRSR